MRRNFSRKFRSVIMVVGMKKPSKQKQSVRGKCACRLQYASSRGRVSCVAEFLRGFSANFLLKKSSHIFPLVRPRGVKSNMWALHYEEESTLAT